MCCPSAFTKLKVLCLILLNPPIFISTLKDSPSPGKVIFPSARRHCRSVLQSCSIKNFECTLKINPKNCSRQTVEDWSHKSEKDVFGDKLLCWFWLEESSLSSEQLAQCCVLDLDPSSVCSAQCFASSNFLILLYCIYHLRKFALHPVYYYNRKKLSKTILK